MKLLDIEAAIGTAILLLSLPCDASHNHGLQHLEAMGKRSGHSRLHASPRAEGVSEVLQKRGSCDFPSGAGLVAVTPGSANRGWAMSPDQQCTPGSYCPFACPPGQVMAQWSPQATSYTYPISMDGGCYCDEQGHISKPFPNSDYCVSGTGSVSAENECSEGVAFCQTVLPGNEAMLIPTEVPAGSTVTLAIPGPSYWLSTAAHFYVNPPGYSTEDACVWGDGSKPIGNWAPYVVGGNTDSHGNTFFKLGWNPIWTGSSLSSTRPTFGLKIECAGSGCNGLPCSINPSTDGIGGVTSSDQASGAGGANFCVATIPQGSSANVVVFSTDSSDFHSNAAASSPSALPTPSPTPTPTPTPSSSSTSTSSSTSSSVNSISSSSSSPSSSNLSPQTVSSLTSSTVNTTSSSATPENSPHVLFQESNSTSTSTGSGVASATGGTAVETSPIASAVKNSSAPETLISSTLISLGTLSAIFVAFL